MGHFHGVCSDTNPMGHRAQGESPGLGDMFALITGGLGIGAGKMMNKGLLIAYMVTCIITAIWFALAIAPFGLLAAGCSVVNDIVDAACQNSAGESYCCFACTEALCSGTEAGCLWVPSYTTASCNLNNVAAADVPDDTSDCDKDCCDAITGKAIGDGHGEGVCQTNDDVATLDQCDAVFGSYSNDYFTYDGDDTYTNAGCHQDTEGGGADTSGLCDYTTIIWITIFVTLAVSIAGSVMGCCVVCCGNDG